MYVYHHVREIENRSSDYMRLLFCDRSSLELWSKAHEGRIDSIVLRVTDDAPTEGELTVAFKINGHDVSSLSFTYLSSDMLGRHGNDFLLITRNQSAKNLFGAKRKGHAPIYSCFAALSGIALADGVGIVAVGERDQISYRKDYLGNFARSYSELWISLGGRLNNRGWYEFVPPFITNVDDPIRGSHHNRTRRRRKLSFEVQASARKNMDLTHVEPITS